MNRILIIQTAFLGDVILATPIVSELKRLFPETSIDMLVKKGNESLLTNNPHLQSIYIFDKSGGKLKEIRRLTGIFKKNRYDLVINLQRFGSSGIITLLSGAKKKYGFRKNPFALFFTKSFEHSIGNGTHEVARNLSVIKEFGAVDLKRPELFPTDKDFDRAAEITSGKYVCLAPASVWFTKQLPEEKWVELIRKQTPDTEILLIGGPGDKELCERIIRSAERKNVQNLCGALSFLESAALMSKATMNYVNDSGPLHIASSMNAPVTAFFCSTIPEFGFGPLSDQSLVVQVKDNLSCRPCGLHGHHKCPKGHFKCGEDIQI